MDSKAALDLIRSVGVHGLGGYDGCLCTNFEVQGVHVDVSCRKSSGGIGFRGTLLRVYSHHIGTEPTDLVPIAREVARQLVAMEETPVKVRFTDYEHDAKKICVYCGKPRTEAAGYLCEDCKTKEAWPGQTVSDAYDYSPHDFIVAPPSREGETG